MTNTMKEVTTWAGERPEGVASASN
jgi:hypothetical protein